LLRVLAGEVMRTTTSEQLDELSRRAASSARRRLNHNLHR
jgi:hypothetical protein